MASQGRPQTLKECIGRRLKHVGLQPSPASSSRKKKGGKGGGTDASGEGNEWLVATVLGFASKTGKFRLLYDDGDEEWKKLPVLGGGGGGAAGGAGAVGTPGGATAAADEVLWLDDAPGQSDFELRGEQYGITGPGSAEGAAAIGRRLRVYYGRKRMWLDARIDEYDAKKGKHLVIYTLGGKEWIVLSEEQLQWLGGGGADLVAMGSGKEGAEALGRGIEMFLPERKEWVKAQIWQYCPRSDRHLVVFDDDQCVWAELSTEKVKWQPLTKEAKELKRKLSNSAKKEVQQSEQKAKRQKLNPGSSPQNSPPPPPPTATTKDAIAKGETPIQNTTTNTKATAKTAAAQNQIGETTPRRPQPVHHEVATTPEHGRSGRGNPAHGSAGVGKKIKVFREGMWSFGQILDFKPSTRSSLVGFENDAGQEWLLLGREKVECIDDGAAIKTGKSAETTTTKATKVVATQHPKAKKSSATLMMPDSKTNTNANREVKERTTQVDKPPPPSKKPSGDDGSHPVPIKDSGDIVQTSSVKEPSLPLMMPEVPFEINSLSKGGEAVLPGQEEAIQKIDINQNQTQLPPKSTGGPRTVLTAPTAPVTTQTPNEVGPALPHLDNTAPKETNGNGLHGRNALLIKLPQGFEMPKVAVRGTDIVSERGRLLQRLKTLNKMIERVAVAEDRTR